MNRSIFGAILTARLTFYIAKLLPHTSVQGASIAKSVISGISPAYLNKLPHSVTIKIFEAFVMSFHDMFLFAVPVMLFGFVAALFLREKPLRGSATAPKTEVI